MRDQVSGSGHLRFTVAEWKRISRNAKNWRRPITDRQVKAIQETQEVTTPSHERAVREFMERARDENPDRVAETEERYPVLTESELDWRRSREVHLSDRFENTLIVDVYGRRVGAPLVLRKAPRRVTAIAA